MNILLIELFLPKHDENIILLCLRIIVSGRKRCVVTKRISYGLWRLRPGYHKNVLDLDDNVISKE